MFLTAGSTAFYATSKRISTQHKQGDKCRGFGVKKNGKNEDFSLDIHSLTVYNKEIWGQSDPSCNDHRTYHPTSDLEAYRTSLIEEFTLRPPASAKEAAFRIKKLHDLDRSPERVRVFMKKIGMKFRKVGAIPAKADLEKQEDFKKTLEPEIARAKAGESVLLFMDGVHFVQAAFLACLWCFTRIFVAVPQDASAGTCGERSMRSAVNSRWWRMMVPLQQRPFANCYESWRCNMPVVRLSLS